MLKVNDLKTWLHRTILTQQNKLLLLLATFDDPCQVKDLKDRAREGGLKITDKWNPSASLGRANGLAISAPTGWELTDAGRTHLRNLGVTKMAAPVAQVSHDLRAELPNIKCTHTRAFAEEAVKCFETSAVSLSSHHVLVGCCIGVLYSHIHTCHLKDLDGGAKRGDPKWKSATTTDHRAQMKEHNSLDKSQPYQSSGMFDDELENCLHFGMAAGIPTL